MNFQGKKLISGGVIVKKIPGQIVEWSWQTHDLSWKSRL